MTDWSRKKGMAKTIIIMSNEKKANLSPEKTNSNRKKGSTKTCKLGVKDPSLTMMITFAMSACSVHLAHYQQNNEHIWTIYFLSLSLS